MLTRNDVATAEGCAYREAGADSQGMAVPAPVVSTAVPSRFRRAKTGVVMKRIVAMIVSLVLSAGFAMAQNPCGEARQRALVLGGGGSKGAFQAGAAYHLIVHRGCDFAEISGTSAGALNGSLLAQAARSDDVEQSYLNMKTQAEALVNLWESLRGTSDIVKNRKLASLRFGLFGLEGMKNFKPLYLLLQRGVSSKRLASGRELRVGTVSFHNGEYHEVVLNPHGTVNPNTIDYLFGSAIIPMFGTMPRIATEDSDGRAEQVQFGDGGLRHVLPIASYFQFCDTLAVHTDPAQPCQLTATNNNPPHPRIEQLFVIATSPFQRHRDDLSADASLFKLGTRQITDGRKVMGRAIDVITNSILNADMEGMFAANDLLRWRAQHATISGWDDSLRQFPVESFNYDPATPERSLPYELAVIVPEFEDGDISALLDFSPARVSRQLYCGCVAADLLMKDRYGLSSMTAECAARFRPRNAVSNGEAPTQFDAAACFTSGRVMAKQQAVGSK
jgi:predicted acylesterase/phospholipase RssA